ncbi:hypothetical protein TorRG33x02_245810 [Trema orientale]|uniref:Uncharacterized protein n=1 Tax=Trema orientale TaxID=63057 RepID=A0A2P5DP13_TREOI|nr:hypothetical protein TorRG33x02_245810 [Trema orientale]
MGLKDLPLRNAMFTQTNLREEVEVRATSDHSLLDSSPPKWGPSPFRFEHMWLDHKDFGKRIKGSVRSQNMSVFGDLRLKDAATLTRIELETESGEVVDKEEDIVREVVTFFEILFTSQQGEFSGFEGVHWSPINNTLADWIERPFEEDEIKKASQLLGINLEDDVISEKAIRIGCEVGHWPMKYRVLPFGGNPLKSIFWEPVRRKIAKRLDGWKRVFLSRGKMLTH